MVWRTASRTWPHRWVFPIVGGWIGLLIPFGLMVGDALQAGNALSSDWLWLEIGSRAWTFSYLTAANTALFASLGWWLGRQQDELERLSVTDELTGLVNRRAFARRLTEEIYRHRRSDRPLALLFVDVDRLKRVNDELGHRAGDALLRHVAQALVASCRRFDVIARWGGDQIRDHRAQHDDDRRCTPR